MSLRVVEGPGPWLEGSAVVAVSSGWWRSAVSVEAVAGWVVCRLLALCVGQGRVCV